MMTPSPADRRQERRKAAILVGAALAVFAAGFAFILTRPKANHIIVLVTGNDCRRLFTDDECKTIVARAQTIHARTAPRYKSPETCAFIYGAGRCGALEDNNVTLHMVAPALAAIALTRDQGTILPLHYGPLNESGSRPAAGRPIYYKDRKIGRLIETSIGGAELPELDDAEGKPLTAEALRRLSE